MKKTYNYNGIDYIYPTSFLISDNGIGQSEYAARQCYNSFDKSENPEVQQLRDSVIKFNEVIKVDDIDPLQNVENSALLEQLSFVHFHESTLEHSVLTFLLTDFSRGVLQELSRHRIASYSVQSTRYTLSDIINAFTACMLLNAPSKIFVDKVLGYDMFVTTDVTYNRIELHGIYDKMKYHYDKIGQTKYLELAVAKSVLEKIPSKIEYHALVKLLGSKDKRNVGDSFKHIISDNLKVNAVMTINLRSFKNFLSLRDSGAAYFQMQKLAQSMKNVTPDKYLKLIIRNYERG